MNEAKEVLDIRDNPEVNALFENIGKLIHEEHFDVAGPAVSVILMNIMIQSCETYEELVEMVDEFARHVKTVGREEAFAVTLS